MDMLNVAVQQEAISVGTASVILMTEQKDRQIFHIRNISAGGQVITLAFGKAAVANVGIILQPGEYYQESADEGFICWNGVVTAISSLAGGVVSVVSR